LFKCPYFKTVKAPLGGFGGKKYEGLSLSSFGLIRLGVLNKEKALPTAAAVGHGLYYFHPFRKQAFFGLKIIKP
jgi:hypothetical protein